MLLGHLIWKNLIHEKLVAPKNLHHSSEIAMIKIAKMSDF